jgi:hypothetical protein
MSLKRKILVLLSLFVVLLASFAFWLREPTGKVRVTFAGHPANDNRIVAFTVTNSFTRPIVYYLAGSHGSFRYSNYTGQVGGRSSETFCITERGRTVGTTGNISEHWNVVVFYSEAWRASLPERTRANLARFASRLGWTRVSARLKPASKFKGVSSPEMIDDRVDDTSHPE